MTKYEVPQILKDNFHKLPKENAAILTERNWITTNDLIYIHQHYLSSISLKSLTNNLKFYKSTTKSSYTPEFTKNLEYLKLKQEETEYQKLINKDYDPNNGAVITPSQMAKEIKSQITTIFNILVSTLSVSYAIWYWSNSSGYFALGTRVLMCLFFGILTLIAEVVVFNSYLRKIDESKLNEAKKKEVTEVLETIVLNKKE